MRPPISLLVYRARSFCSFILIDWHTLYVHTLCAHTSHCAITKVVKLLTYSIEYKNGTDKECAGTSP